MEKKVIDNMKENPKVLFDYIRRQKDRDTKIGPFKRGKDYIYDSREICKMLIEQYNSQFSETNDTMKATKEEINNIEDDDISEILFISSFVALIASFVSLNCELYWSISILHISLESYM